jgi:3-hydroxybutyrate dehydrogenase
MGCATASALVLPVPTTRATPRAGPVSANIFTIIADKFAGSVAPTKEVKSRPLAGKVAVVTGSSSGIGLSCAELLASKGANIVLHGSRDRSQMAELEADLARENNVKCQYIRADMSKPEEVTSLIEQATAAFGKVDILVNNAGVQHVAPIEEFSESDFDWVLGINLKAIFMGTKAVIGGMKERGYGRIINVASAHGKVASLNKSAYVASKHAVVGLTKVTALEAAGTGVTCVTVCPGWVLTPLVEKQIAARAEKSGNSIEEETRLLVSEKHPSGQAATPDDMANLIAFLCSPAANQITGTEISVDGGWCAV